MKSAIELFNEGLLPLENETEEQFQKRGETALEFVMKEKKKREIPACSQKEPYILCFYSKENLSPWEGGAFFFDETSPLLGFIQINPLIKTKLFRTIYEEEEIFNHEKVHAKRALFEDSPYEEILAYETSKFSLRRIIGPLFSTTKETVIFIGLICISLSIEFFVFVMDFPFIVLQLVAMIPFVYLMSLYVKLKIFKARLSCCRRNIQKLLKPKVALFSFLLCLKKEEIEFFSKRDEKTIADYINQQAKKSLRWNLIRQAYLM